MVRGLGKGHCDRHPLVTQVRAEASLSPAAGTPCAAACIVACSHQQRGHPLGPEKASDVPGQVAALNEVAPGGGGGGGGGGVGVVLCCVVLCCVVLVLCGAWFCVSLRGVTWCCVVLCGGCVVVGCCIWMCFCVLCF